MDQFILQWGEAPFFLTMQRRLKFHIFENIPSTQELAKTLSIQPNTVHVVLAFEQTAGQGTFGKTWLSPKHSGLYISLTFKLGDKIPKQTLSLLAAAACAECLASIHPTIKWPNDLLVKEKKIGGILTEVFEDRIIVGIGINLKTPPSLLGTLDQCATAWNQYEKPPEVDDLAHKLSETFMKFLDLWEKEGFKMIKPVYTRYFPLIGKEVIAELPEGLQKGLLIDFSDEGYPILKIGDLLQTLTHVKHLNLNP